MVTKKNYRDLKAFGVPLYECYSPKQWAMIEKSSIDAIFVFVNNKTSKKAKIFLLTKELELILLEWSNNSTKGVI